MHRRMNYAVDASNPALGRGAGALSEGNQPRPDVNCLLAQNHQDSQPGDSRNPSHGNRRQHIGGAIAWASAVDSRLSRN